MSFAISVARRLSSESTRSPAKPFDLLRVSISRYFCMNLSLQTRHGKNAGKMPALPGLAALRGNRANPIGHLRRSANFKVEASDVILATRLSEGCAGRVARDLRPDLGS